jgi:hypothetical protein
VLARRGARVTIFDASHPREKPCGGGVTGRALALVADAVPAAACPASVIRSARFTDSGRGQSAAVALETQGATAWSALLVASRAAFDAALLEAAERAGALLVRSRVTNALPPQSTVDRYRLLRARRHERRDRHRTDDGSAGLPLVVSTSRPSRHRHLRSSGRGNRGRRPAQAGGRMDRLDPDRTRGEARTVLVANSVAERRGFRHAAAGLVDPITREGIYFAIASGQSIAEALAAGNPARGYAARVRDEAVSELGRAARLKAGFFRPAFAGLMIGALHQSAGIRAVMADLVAGRQSYATLKWRLLKTFEMGLAWRALAGSWSASLSPPLAEKPASFSDSP